MLETAKRRASILSLTSLEMRSVFLSVQQDMDLTNSPSTCAENARSDSPAAPRATSDLKTGFRCVQSAEIRDT